MKQTLRLLLILLLYFPLPDVVHAQFRDNIQSIGGSYGDEVVKVLHDKEENRYILGRIGMPGSVPSFNNYKGEAIDFGNLQQPVINMFIAKYDKYNRCVWVRPCPRDMKDSYTDFAIDDTGFVYVTGSVYYSHFVLEKLDPNGQLVWEKSYRPGMFKIFTGHSIVVDKQGNVYVAGSFDGTAMDTFTFNFTSTDATPSTDFLAKFSPTGEVLWVETSLKGNLTYTHLMIDAEGNLLTAGGFKDTISIGGHTLINNTPPDSYGKVYDRFFAKRDPAGNVLWAKSYPLRINGVADMVLDREDNIYLTAPSFFNDPASVTIDGVLVDRSQKQALLKLDKQGTVQWATSFQGSYSWLPLLYANNSLYVAGDFSGTFRFQDQVLVGNKPYVNDLFLVKLNLAGKVLEATRYGGPAIETKATLSYLPQRQEIVVAGSFSEQMPNNGKFLVSKGSNDIFIARIPQSEGPMAWVSGKLFVDENYTCTREATEKGLANKLLKIEPGSQYASTDEQGNFSFPVAYGSYLITPQLGPYTKVQHNCQESKQVVADGTHQQIQNVDFGYVIRECSQLTVAIAADRRRRCFRSHTTVTYTNEGTVDESNVKIKVIYPRYVVPISSQMPWVSRLDSALIFDVGTLKAGERKSFVITDSTVCGIEGIRGLSQCVQAFITPKSTCDAPSPDWSKASVVVVSSFRNQEKTAAFTIANQGAGNMSDSTTYRLYANAALIKRGKVMLAQGASKTLELPMQAVTYRLEADQVLDHPGNSRPTVSLQPPVMPLGTQEVTLPIPIDAFYQDDADAEVASSCLPITDSYDPNDKQVSPQGVTSKRYVKAEDELTYMVRFQNTGTDEAYNVVVEDTISEYLDISTLRVGSASHPYTYSISGKGKPLLRFTFKDIHLPDNKTNEPASHGYITFTIAQHAGNPKGTVIRNTAYNYFDYNSAVATNEVVNVVGDTVLLLPVPMAVYDCSEDAPTIAKAGADIRLCEANSITLDANQPEKGIGQWVLVSGQATIADRESPTSAVQVIGYGETVLEWTITLCRKVSRSQLTISRFPMPPAPSITQLPLQCEGSSTHTTLTATGRNITWYQDEAKQHKLFAGSSYTPTVSETATFYATQTVNGCESPVSASVMRLYSKIAIITSSADTLIAPPADRYQWYFNDQPIAGATNQKLVVKNTGQYRVQTITNGCEANSDIVSHTVNVPKAVLQLSPNPVRGELLVALTANATGVVSISVRSQLGKQVTSMSTQKRNTVLELPLQLSELAPGMYFLNVHVGGEVLVAKLIKL
ncbi:DUF7619 domain-containing protein [Pontibacter chitinilyticus]|uniref:DUF7619 domain-containing protein n=1 Tax=Pontibacter chitinilyticus TaxID=2674989 RepID=UPI003219740A